MNAMEMREVPRSTACLFDKNGKANTLSEQEGK